MSDGTAPTPSAVSLEPPKITTKGKPPTHSPEVVAGIAKAATKGWTSNGLFYKTRSGAQGACQGLKEAIVADKHANATSDLSARVWQLEDGQYVFAIVAKAALK